MIINLVFVIDTPLLRLLCLSLIKSKEPLKINYILVRYFLNLSKAFDTVDHNILLAKLEHYEIRGLLNEWFCSYLTNRQQFISVNNSDSDPLQITCGVPQGSVLGPVLFLIYMNDFTNCSSIFDFHLFADDTNLFHTYSGLQHLEQNVNRELSEISLWLCAN